MATSTIPFELPGIISDTGNGTEYTMTLPFRSDWNEYAIVIGYRCMFYLFIDTDDVTTYVVPICGTTTMTCTKLSRQEIKMTFSTTQWGGVRVLYLG